MGVAVLLSATAPRAMAQSSVPSSLADADTAYRAGVAALNRHDLHAARLEFQKAAQLAPDVEQVHTAYGSVLVQSGATAEGIRELEKALAMKGDDTTAQLTLAVAYVQAGTARRAIPIFQQLQSNEHQKLPPYAVQAYAGALAGIHRAAEAERVLREAVAQEPGNAELHDALGSLYAQQYQWSEAQAAFEEALRLDPALASAHLHLGLALAAQQKPNALGELRQAAQLAPKNPVVLEEMGKYYAGVGQDKQAMPYLRRAMQVEGGAHSEAKYQLALALQRTGQIQEARSLLTELAQAEPKNANVLTNLGLVLMQSGRAKEAVPYLQRAVTLAPGNTVAHQNLAGAYIEVNEISEAVQELRSSVRLSPGSPQLHYNLGLALKMQDNNAAAIPEFEKAEKLDHSQSEAPYALGMLYLQNGQYADAARELNTSLKLHPQNGDGWATLGSVYLKLDQLKEAESALKEAIRQMPQQAEPHLTLGTVLAREGEQQEAATERKTGAELMRASLNHQRAEVASNQGASLLEKGQIADAISQYQTALGYDPKYAEAHRGLANALDRAGKPLEAAAERRKAIEPGRSPAVTQ